MASKLSFYHFSWNHILKHLQHYIWYWPWIYVQTKYQTFLWYVITSSRVSNLVVVDADDTNWHQRWQCQHWMTPIDTRMNWKIIYAGPAGLWKYNKIWSSGKCFWIHETSEMNFLQFLSNLAMKEENYFFRDTKNLGF